ncbi:MAG: TraR/DksA C4-type zinc finger protein [bacterium]|nr:TraR/DksA C4-type zinc finger protein [bacterium]
MTEEERLTIRHKIKANIEAINEHIASLEFSVMQIPQLDELDKASRSEAINYKRRCEADIRKSMKKLSDYEVALKRVDAPGFGICIECDKPIQITKLMLIPETMFCVRCHKL